MKSFLVQAFVALGLVLAAVAVSASEELVRDQFGVRARDAPIDFAEENDPEKELDFVWFGMDKKSEERDLHVVRGLENDARDLVAEKPIIVPFGRAQVVNGTVSTNDRARSFVFRNLDKNEGRWILYPYNFTYIEPPFSESNEESSGYSSNESSEEPPWRQGNQTLPDGAMISTMGPENFPLHTYMNWIESKTDMNLKKAKVIYDINVAVLQIQADREDDNGIWNSVDLTYDSNRFTTAFYSNFNPKYAGPFFGMKAYQDWVKVNPTKADQACYVLLSPNDILNNSLFTESGENFFGMLIIPDIKMNELEFLKKNVSSLMNTMQSFVQKGGMVFTTGKGAFLTEAWSLVPDGTFDPQYTMTSPNQTWQYTEGCDLVGRESPKDNTEAEFKESTLCFSLPYRGAQSYNSLASAPLLATPAKNHGLKSVLWFSPVNPKSWARPMKHDEKSGLEYELDETEARSYPALMYKAIGKGHLVVNMGNPALAYSTFQHIYNAFLLAGQRPIGVDNLLVGGFNRTVPGLEQVDLNVSVNVINYFTQDMSGAKLYVHTIQGTEVKVPSTCTKVTSGAPAAPEKIKVKDTYLCTLDPKKLTNSSFPFNIRIVDPLVTQQKKNVVVLWPHLQYVDTTRNNLPVTVSYGVKIQAAMSALLRADMNIDPSSTYPLHASGSFIDNVMNCENKEETAALRVEHVSIVPLISPLIDILDQVRLATAMILDQKYYLEDINKVGFWEFPFPQEGGDNRKADYLDWVLLIERSDQLAADWDEGVKLFRETRDKHNLPPPKGLIPKEHVMNAEFQTNNDDDTFLLKQFQFDDSDKFYEHAVQRLMAFLDVSTAGGASTYWGDNIPDDEKSASNPNVGKRRILFVRHDIYFYTRYLLPLGVDKSFFQKYITLDKYTKNDVGDQRSVQGEFGNNVPDGMIPAEYPAKIQFFGNRASFNVTGIEEATGGKVKLIHYIVPIHPNDGKKAGDFYHIDPSTGRHIYYPEVQFTQTYALNVDIRPEHSRRGGDIVFTFDSNDLPWSSVANAVKDDLISVSADQIAVYSITSPASNKLRLRFKRGQMPNEAYGRPSHLQIFFENTRWVTNDDKSPSKTVTMDVFEMHYDLSKPESGYEDWSTQSVSGQSVTFNVKGAFRLPALRLHFVINDDLEESFMNPYELREPLVRYGLYEQELESHRAVHGSSEFHPKTEPCIVTVNGGFSTFTHVGTSSVPFREYVSTGTSLQIPAASETGRVEWDDIWGRHFVQNVRSTIFEYPPIPPPLRNFVMTTTFEILDKSGKRMFNGWRSNEKVDVHVQMKLLNNYPKWFEVTACKENRVLQSCTTPGKSCGKARIYDTDNNFVYPEGEDDGKLYFKRGQNASYGVCLASGTVRLQGQLLNEAQKNGILAMTLCAKEFNSYNHSCEYEYPGLPILNRTPDVSLLNGTDWNYATNVLNYWPDGYIKGNMWDLTHYDYDDNQFDKAYKYHMDNNLPHLGHGNTRPDNLISFPLFKGLGYSMVYDKTYSNARFGSSRKGWWSDNLQNRDHTLVAGNKKSNDVSVGQASLIPDSEWVDMAQLHDAEELVLDSEKNVYSCLFNRRAVKNYKSNTKVTELFNVYENNVVPVPIDFDDTMEHNFQCTRQEWYTPLNISQYPNTVYTETPRDWLYFGANLRGGALEDINVLYQLSPLETNEIKFEGYAKVQDGGRFVYWNPANSKNSYLVVDNPVHVVLAKRNDIEVAQELIPTYTTTFDSVVYHHFTISDPEEIEREWESPIYTNNYGYGDFTVQVYVGDAGTTALPSPGTTIRARLTFMNNAGFDINMLKNAINSTEVSQESINAYEMMYNIVRTLRRPDYYNFLEFQVPDEIKNYIRIYPCPSVVGIAPLFFDFDSINVVTIRDGWKGDYYVNIEIKKDFPRELRGRLIEIPIKLVKHYFDRFPGKGDVTGAHDYEVEVPSIMFGVPYANDDPLWAGKVFYTSGYATDVDPRTSLAKPFGADEAMLVSDLDLEEYRKCLGMDTNPDQNTTEGEFACLDRLWNTHKKDHDMCNFTVLAENKDAQTISFKPCMDRNAPTFPVKVKPIDGPDHAELHILLRTHANQVKSGYPKVSTNVSCSYNDWTNKTLRSPTLGPAQVHAKGAWISLRWSFSLLSSSGMPLSDPLISPNNSGLADVRVTVENTGDYYAYNVMFNLTLAADVRIATKEDSEGIEGDPVPPNCAVTKISKNETMFSCNVSALLAPGSPITYPFRVFYNPDTRKGAGYKAVPPLDMRVIAERSSASIDLTASAGEKRVTQDLEGPHGFAYTKRIDSNMVVLTGRRNSEYDLTLSASHQLSSIRAYIWRAKLPSSSVWTTIAVTKEPTLNDYVSERYEKLGGEGIGDEIAVDYVVAVSRTKSKVTVDNSDQVSILTQSNSYEWRVSESNVLLLLLLLPGLLIPALLGAAVFATTKGKNKEPVRELGMAPKQKFVPQELVDEDPAPLTETEMSAPPPPLPQRAAPAYVPPEPAPQAPTKGKAYAIPTGPTYLRAGVPVNVVDS